MRKTQLLIALAAIGFAGSAVATDGYFSHGNGMIAKGMGGAATAMAEDTFGGANNPASMVWVGSRIDLGADLFSPIRSAERSGGGLAGSADSNMEYFLIPEFGYNRMVNPDLSLGVSVFGNGGMNTSYSDGQINCGAGPANLLCGSGPLGVNLMQLIIAPTAAYKINESHSIGISPLFGYQLFKATGLDAFTAPAGSPMQRSSSPGSVTNQGDSDDASGWGVRIGWQGRITPTLTLGAAYSSKIDMSKFNKYKGLFAEQGDFDIPENYNLGLAFQAMPNLTVALDYQRINYGGVKAIANASTNPVLLGSDNGPGFGWKDINVWKLGAAYKMDDKMTLRAGYNHTDNPIQSADTMFNILAPGVVKDHLTLGMSYAMSKTSDLTVSYMHAFENSVSGPDYLGAGGTDKIKMYQNSLGVAYSWKL